MNAPMPHPAERLLARPLPAQMLSALSARFGPRLSTALAVREQHGRDESPFDVPPPDAVVFCESTEEVAFAVSQAAQHQVPVIPYGAGSSLEGHLLAVQGGLSIDLSRMNRVVQVHADDLTCTVEAGVLRTQLNREVKDMGLFFPIDPGADASIGGMTATRASGTNAVRYGTMRENVLGLTVVTASGEVIRTGTRARKSSAGYDLTRLMVGSEGTLGVITEITLKLHPLPESVAAAICFFPDVEGAVNTTIQLIQMGVPIARCEFLDRHAVRAVNLHDKLGLTEAPMLLMEFHGSAASVAEQAATVQEIARDLGGNDFQWATTPEERTRLWTARHHAYLSGLQMKPGCRAITTDTCVPISQLAGMVTAALDDAEAAGLPHFVVGHVGDGNFHIAYLIDPALPEERERAEALNDRVVQRAIAVEGTCTGEHGIGLHKQGFLVEETGAGSVAMMRAIKLALDPHNILNPGKIFQL
ncbi:FAD-binding oxidoreductase [Ideonella margarita]|uniref:D-lactate dehydrogenase (cytochrome) n=1 Tax=Ideonella margarita TaxID=2984191 RepID=A0ABU9C4J3_9BURK